MTSVHADHAWHHARASCHAHKCMNVEVHVHEAVGPYNHCALALDPFWVLVLVVVPGPLHSLH